MAALVQTLPLHHSPTMLHQRPTSADAFQTPPSRSHQQQHPPPHQNAATMPRHIYNTSMSAMAPGNYRGSGLVNSASAYAFAPNAHLAAYPHNPSNPLRQHPTPMPHPRLENRTASAPAVPLTQPVRSRPATAGGLSSSTSHFTLPDPLAMQNLNTSYANAAKGNPDRYRRNSRSPSQAPHIVSAMASGSGMAAVGNLYTHPNMTSSTPALAPYPRASSSGNAAAPAADDTVGQRTSTDLAKRYRRRSISSMEVKDHQTVELPAQRSYAATLAAPAPANNRSRVAHESSVQPASREEISGSKSFTVSNNVERDCLHQIKRDPGTPVMSQTSTPPLKDPKTIRTPVATPQLDIPRRHPQPSPLSQSGLPTSRGNTSIENLGSAKERPATPESLIPESAAAQHLASLNTKDKKSSKLRRAFSFGSAAELRKASAEDHAAAARERHKLQKPQHADEQDAQQAAIARQQEAAGLGEGIYSGQGNVFTGSTDNLSISSTASSASLMLRKMGKGVKRGSRSLVGLFRPKSVVGVPAADAAAPEASVGPVSLVTVEAEREKVNVNVDPHDQAGGGTGFPKLERNSLDAATNIDTDTPSRQSILGSDRDRAEILAAVKKGILKRHGTDSASSSPQSRPLDSSKPDFNLPQIPRMSDSPTLIGPLTPSEGSTPRGHAPSDSLGQDYFSGFATPQGAGSRNISFSPRIIFHDTWPSGEYDRRGEIATCNRLTPMLAQQIKEELNSFKMVRLRNSAWSLLTEKEMDIHVESKTNTHFF